MLFREQVKQQALFQIWQDNASHLKGLPDTPEGVDVVLRLFSFIWWHVEKLAMRTEKESLK